MDILFSLSFGLINVIKDVFGFIVVVVFYDWFVGEIGLFEIKFIWLVYILVFIGFDFVGYWVYCFLYSVNYFWNWYIIYYSSEEFNLGCVLWQLIFGFVVIMVFFLLLIVILGVLGEVVVVVVLFYLFVQYWYYICLIGKMGVLEYIIVMFFYYCVYYVINKEYLDKNFFQIFIVWDKIFGIFQEELEDVLFVYGVICLVCIWNFIIINFVYFWQFIKDVWCMKDWKVKFMIWFKLIGWCLVDVKEKYLFFGIEDFYIYEKYDLKFFRVM